MSKRKKPYDPSEETGAGRILDGLADALRIAECDHPAVVSRDRGWLCPTCGGLFSRDPLEAA